MARRVGLQWNKGGYQQELARQVKNYNERIRYAQKKNPGAVLPPRVKVSELKKEISTVRQFNQVVRDLKSATAKTLTPDKQGITPYERKLKQRQARRKSKTVVDEVAKKRAAALAGLSVETPKNRFPTEQQFISRRIGLESLSETNYDTLQQWIKANPTESARWKENYLKAIDESLERSLNIGDAQAYEKLQELYRLINYMDIEDFLIGELTKPEQVQQTYVYGSKFDEESEWANRVDRIIEEWQDLYS